MKKYKIQNYNLSQSQLTVGQALKLSEFGDLIDVQEAKNYNELITVIINKHLSKFMNQIIFTDQNTDKIDWLKVPYDKIDEIFEDFFVLNPRLITRLRSIFENFLRPAMQKAINEDQK